MMRGIQACILALAFILGSTGQSQALFGFGSSSGEKVSPKAVFDKLMQGAKNVCEKGSGLSKITIRSGNGIACKNKVVAALATMKCGKRADFAGSHCGQNAKHALGGKAPKQVLMEEAKKGGSMAISALKKFGGKGSTHAKPAVATEDEAADDGDDTGDTGGNDDAMDTDDGD